jgi:aminomethyltransferase
MTQEVFSPQLTIGPRVRKSPFFDATVRWGVKAFTVYNHMYMPTVYTDPVDEYWKLVNDVTLWDVACERQVEITGPDAAKFVQLLTPRNLQRCRVGQCRYVILTAEDGGVLNDAVLLRLGENQFWLSPGDGDMLLWAQGVAVSSGMDVTIDEPDASPLQLQGPKAPRVAHALFGDWALDLGYYHLKETELDGIPLVLSRTGWSGELGYELFLRDGRQGDALWEKIMEAGKPYGIAPIAPNLIRSVEGAIFSYCSDITRDDNPFTIGFDRMVHLDHDFIGREALTKIKVDGVKRRLVGVEISGDSLLGSNDQFWAVSVGGTKVGRVTRCVYSPRMKKNIGFVNVPAEYSETGSKLTVAVPSGDAEATVVPTPFIESQKKIPR